MPPAEARAPDLHLAAEPAACVFGAPGNSWLNHWEVTAGRKPVPTPAADWIKQAYSALDR